MSFEKKIYVVEPEAVKQIASYGITYPKHALAKSPGEAVVLAEKIGFPVVMKVVSSDVIHKSDAGGVLLNLQDAEAVRAGYEKIVGSVHKAMPPASVEGVLVCEQAPDGVEVIVGATQDPVFGMILMFGLGGIFTEVLKDVAFRVVPLKEIDAEEMIQEIKGFPVLSGARGMPPSDLKALSALLLSVSRFISERPDIRELDLNPVRLYAKGLQVLDIRLMTS